MNEILLYFIIILTLIGFALGYLIGTESKRNELLCFPDKALPCRSLINEIIPNRPNSSCRKRHCSLEHSIADSSLMKMINYIANAKSKIYLCMFQFTLNSLADVLIYKSSNGCQVLIITDLAREKNENDQIPKLRKNNIQVVERTDQLNVGSKRPLMHNKYVIIDKEVVMHGSLNWTIGAVLHNRETVTISHDKELVKAFARNFVRIYHSIKG